MYKNEHLATIVPTKDRPQHIRNLLESLAAQTWCPGRIVIVDGGESVESVVEEFKDRLNITYETCQPPGQIRQRLKGLQLVDESTPLIGFLDDDVVLEPDAIEKMIAFWNQSPPETAGVGFNMANIQPHRYSRLRALLGMSGEPGKILSSGYNISIVNQSSDIRTEWLAGGYTVWKLSVIREFPQTDLRTRWAAGEDVRFSYPIGKKYPLFVCSSARIHDMGQTTQMPASNRARFQGRKECLAYFYLVELHPELSRLRCLWMVTASSLALFIKAVMTRRRSINRAIGQALSVVDFFKAQIGRTSLKSALED